MSAVLKEVMRRSLLLREGAQTELRVGSIHLPSKPWWVTMEGNYASWVVGAAHPMLPVPLRVKRFDIPAGGAASHIEIGELLGESRMFTESEVAWICALLTHRQRNRNEGFLPMHFGGRTILYMKNKLATIRWDGSQLRWYLSARKWQEMPCSPLFSVLSRY